MDVVGRGEKLFWQHTGIRHESELVFGLTFCMVLETELRLDEVDAAHRFLRKLEHTLEGVHRNIDEARGLPACQLRNLRKHLEGLDQRVSEIEVMLNGGATGEEATAEHFAAAEQVNRNSKLQSDRAPRR